jgi:GNAT superfamily N-acetyltransferase
MDIREIITRENFADIASLHASFGEAGRRSATVEYYQWKYGRSGSRLFGAFEGDQVVSMAGVCSKPFDYAGSKALVFEIGDTFTHPSAQRRGFFSALISRCLDHLNGIGEPYLVYGTPNANSRPPYLKRFRFTDWPTQCVQVVGSLSRESLGAWSGRSGAKLSLLSSFSRVASCFGGQNRLGSALQARFDPNLRSSYLRWRYVQNPDEYTILRESDKSYAVTKHVHERGVRCVYIAEATSATSFCNAARASVTPKCVVTGWIPRGFSAKSLRYGLVPVRYVPWISFSNLREAEHHVTMSLFLKEHAFIGVTDNI